MITPVRRLQDKILTVTRKFKRLLPLYVAVKANAGFFKPGLKVLLYYNKIKIFNPTKMAGLDVLGGKKNDRIINPK